MGKKILIIEDEINLVKVLSDSLEKENFEIIEAYDGQKGVELFYDKKPDFILLDINLPKKNGWQVCQEIREESNIPIIMMTARDSEIDELKGLNIGADDYITKPFNLKILTVKIKKLLKIDENSSYKNKELYIDFKRGKLTISDEEIELTRREIQFLEYLIRNKGIIFTREQLLNEIWGFDFEGNDRVVDTLVKRIRKKLGEYSDNIKTVRGMGYIFNED